MTGSDPGLWTIRSVVGGLVVCVAAISGALMLDAFRHWTQGQRVWFLPLEAGTGPGSVTHILLLSGLLNVTIVVFLVVVGAAARRFPLTALFAAAAWAVCAVMVMIRFGSELSVGWTFPRSFTGLDDLALSQFMNPLTAPTAAAVLGGAALSYIHSR